jgi:hypothetical protein
MIEPTPIFLYGKIAMMMRAKQPAKLTITIMVSVSIPMDDL